MKHLFLTDRLDEMDIESDTTHLLMAEAGRRGHEVIREDYFSDVDVSGFDVVWVRKDPPVDEAYISRMKELAEVEGPFFVNDPAAILKYGDKMMIFDYPAIIADTAVTSDSDTVNAFIREHGKAVVKPLNSFSGIGVELYKKPNYEGTEEVMVQEYLPNVTAGDTRVHVAGGEVIGALLRVPQAGDFRGNIHAGGTAVKADLDDDLLEKVEAVAGTLMGKGIFFAGLDFIDGRLNEVNTTSPGVIRETNAVSGDLLEVKLFDILEKHVRV